jgi:hypothetical protein
MKKIKLKAFACSLEKLLLGLLKLFANFENPSSNPLKRPESGYFETENAHRSRL